MTHPDLATDAAEFRFELAPDDPFTSLHFHFGMLLGVDDFETEQAYHRGKLRLHQAWLHGSGVVWGLAVALDQANDELRVEPGVALDGAGRELHLDAPACLNPGAWYEEHEDEVEPLEAVPDGVDVAFDAHVEARWASCLTRPVPALAEPCANTDVESAYSRRWETIDLRLAPGAADAPADRYRRVRILLGLLEPGGVAADADAAQARADALAAGDAAAALAALRAMANADAIDLAPPDPDEGPLPPVVLANLRGVALRRTDDGWKLVGGTVELLPRRSHIGADTVLELAAATLGGAAGPRITGVTLDGAELTLALSAPLDARSVHPGAFAVSSLAASGWEDVAVTSAEHDRSAPAVRLGLADKPPTPWQLIARGSGPAPLVAADTLTPLGGGHDFAHLERS
jgi:hypothetical protein